MRLPQTGHEVMFDGLIFSANVSLS
jgi:hypothetical protein